MLVFASEVCLDDNISKCFLQILLPEEQQDLFRILWFKDNDVNAGEIEEFKFTLHAWGIVSSPCYSKLACLGFKQKPFTLQDSNHYVFEQKTFCNMRKGMLISIIDQMSCLLSLFVVSKLFCLVMFSFFFLDP